MIKIKAKTVKLSEIHLNPDNPRTITKQAMGRLVKSLQEFPEMMELREIVVDETMMVLGGNMRLLALQTSKATQCRAKIVSGLTPEQKREFVIKDNAAFGSWDMGALANSWSDLPLIEWGIDLPAGWMATDPGDPKDAEPQIDKAEELNKVWKVKTGDLWQIGDHRLLCGDSTKAEDVARVMGGEKADLLLTDPPYGINADRQHFEGCGWTLREKTEWDKSRPSPQAFDLIKSSANNGIIWGGNYFTDMLPPSMGWLIWDKGQRDFGLADGEMAWTSFNNATRIKTFSRAVANKTERQHPTQKPVEIIAWCIECADRNSKGKIAILLDPYIGSGTTMVACQNLNRKCRGIEISPPYCAVILQRMTDAFPGIEIRRIKQ